MGRGDAATLAVALLLGLAGCTAPGGTDMTVQPSLRPQQQPRPSAAGTLPMGGEPSVDRVVAAAALRNPVTPSAASVGRGEKLFGIYCALCHGPRGQGDGPVAQKFMPPPDLTMKAIAERTDGYLYATIRNGGALMPGLGESLTPEERWDVVNFLRRLQRP